MAPSYNFAILRLAPETIRHESINIGVVVVRVDSLDIRLSKKLDKVRAISAALELETVYSLVSNLNTIDQISLQSEIKSPRDRLTQLMRLGPLKLGSEGTFTAADTLSYESRINYLLHTYVEPEPAPKKIQPKKTRLLTEIKKAFRKQRVLALPEEDLASHRIVPTYPIDDGLVADLVLKNGAYHVVETVDISDQDIAIRRAVTGIAVSALVLERARMMFGESKTNAKLVYEASASLEKIARPSLEAVAHQGAELINWASHDDQNKFLLSLASLATPVEAKQGKQQYVVAKTGFLFH